MNGESQSFFMADADSGFFELDPKHAIEGAVLDGFAHVFRRDGVGGGEVGDGAGDFQDAVAGTGAQG